MKLPTMHVILDTVEQMVRESISNPEEWTRFEMQLYTPDKGETNLDGWTGDDQFESFDALLGAVGG